MACFRCCHALRLISIKHPTELVCFGERRRSVDMLVICSLLLVTCSVLATALILRTEEKPRPLDQFLSSPVLLRVQNTREQETHTKAVSLPTAQEVDIDRRPVPSYITTRAIRAYQASQPEATQLSQTTTTITESSTMTIMTLPTEYIGLDQLKMEDEWTVEDRTKPGRSYVLRKKSP